MKTIVYTKAPALRPLTGKEVWEVSRDWFVYIHGAQFVIRDGFKTDGASIPRFLWRVCGHPMATGRIIPALVHDAIYDGEIQGFTRAEADAIYRDGLIDEGWPKWKAYVEWAAIRAFGAKHWNEDYNLEEDD